MRKFLLTWYGITDFRASLGFENTDGPIAAALASEAYSDVVVLCYTRQGADAGECVDTRNAFSGALDVVREARQEKDWKATGEFVSKFANTDAAHRHFVHWLKTKVGGSDTRIWFKSEKLRELNDTEGIYACAMRALDFVEKEPGEKLVTLYLSPGTPVMAFVWALAALSHPDLKKRLIASPVVGKPPETISLPLEWLERHGARQEAKQHAVDGFDLTYHLFGEQRMPALLGIRQFESKRHIFVNSKEYPAACMRKFIPGTEYEELPVDPWDAAVVRDEIIRSARIFPQDTRIGINLTGGTKLMFAGALAAARAIGAVPFYFDSRNRRVTYVDSLLHESVTPIDSVETFLLLNGDGLKVSRTGEMEEIPDARRLLTQTLWTNRAMISRHYKELCKIAEQHEALRKSGHDITPFRIECEGFVFGLDKNKVATVAGNGLDLRLENQPGFAKFLCGGWFEEYVYLLCKPYEDAGVIKDLRINVEVHLDREHDAKPRQWNATFNELDVVFTDGHSLYIAECKAGNVTQEQVMKLQNMVRFYGGVDGRGIVACCFPPNAESVRKKIKDARLQLWSGDHFPDQLRAFLDRIADESVAVEETR